MQNIIDGPLLRKMIISASNELNANKFIVDSLNVFPVPDGDTGTNMSLTFIAAAVEVEKVVDVNVSNVAKAAANGSLRGARGNSGVILSQLFRGFSKGLEGKSTATKEDIAYALKKAASTAYKAVMKPREGTILTIAKEAYLKAFELVDSENFLLELIRHLNQVLSKTTDMLIQLKQAGVVDAGGKGLLLIFEGAYKALRSDEDFNLSKEVEETNSYSALDSVSNEDITFGYCTEFFINVNTNNDIIAGELKQYLSTIADSIVVVSDEDIIKIHAHSEHPGLIIEKALTYGSLTNLKIDNMREQHNNKLSLDNTKEAGQEEQKELGFVAVALGVGFEELFLDLGVDVVIEGGQTMNPSTEDILNAVNKVNAKNIIILPNNKNIILAAQQVPYLSNDKKVHIVPSKTIPQGISAMIKYDLSVDIEKNLEHMNESIKNVKTGQVTYAVRDTLVDEINILKGDFLGIIEGNISVVNNDLNQTVFSLIDNLVDNEHEVISIYYGSDVSDTDADKIVNYVNDNYSDYEIELHNGKQPLYYYIIAVE